MKKSSLILLLTLTAPALATNYPHVQADIAFAASAPGDKSIGVRVHLHNTGDIAAACVVKLGGQTRNTGVSANGDALVSFDGVTKYTGYTVNCAV